MSDASERHVDAAAERIGRYRWVICGLLFAATAINYIDRQMIGILKPTLQADLGWSETDYANIVLWFQAAYAIGYLGFGRLVDRIGARIGYSIAFSMWTVAHILHGVARTTVGFGAVRFMLGIGESGSFPAGLKAVATWFPARERALAIGIFNAGANVGAIVTPIIVPIITVAYGWRAAFIITGVLSFVWLFAWLAFYRTPRETKRLGAAELALIESDPPDAPGKVAWLRLLRHRETWAFALGKFLTDPIWWMFLFWLPDFLAKRYDLDLMSFGPPLIAIYLLSDVGSVAGGWASSRLIARGYSVNRARKLTMLVCALAVTPIFFAQWVSHLWIAVLIIGLATAAHQAWSANLFTLVSDMFPRKAVGSVIGIGGTAGALGGMLMSKFAGYVLETVGSYQLIFFVAGSVYLVALGVIHLLSPRLERASVAVVA
ncbi:MFS transporter [Hephaestia sp. GCM10023244]|uniref:MFS transporter n=1 Tax=unclassified Hephaestia TaxID=2631281 RepID=UPI0020771E22|nr:MFS transporter [Hephaestia sp. MAHUQ-44]MCM8729760.1 MFS transporter [Hephaestia sp. MAHUQ-44]